MVRSRIIVEKKKSSSLAAALLSVLPTFPNDAHVIHLFSFLKGYSLAGYRRGSTVTHQIKPSGSNSGDDGGSCFLRQMLKVQDTISIGQPRI